MSMSGCNIYLQWLKFCDFILILTNWAIKFTPFFFFSLGFVLFEPQKYKFDFFTMMKTRSFFLLLTLLHSYFKPIQFRSLNSSMKSKNLHTHTQSAVSSKYPKFLTAHHRRPDQNLILAALFLPNVHGALLLHSLAEIIHFRLPLYHNPCRRLARISMRVLVCEHHIVKIVFGLNVICQPQHHMLRSLLGGSSAHPLGGVTHAQIVLFNCTGKQNAHVVVVELAYGTSKAHFVGPF